MATGKAVHFFSIEAFLWYTCKSKIRKGKTLCFTAESCLKVPRAETHSHGTCHYEDLFVIPSKKEMPKKNLEVMNSNRK